MPQLARRPWVPAACETLIQRYTGKASAPSAKVAARIEQLIENNLEIHNIECFNLNPATNVMSPRAEAALAHQPQVEAAVHVGLLNRGSLIAPFHNMMLVSPATTKRQIDRLIASFDEILTDLFA